jgi:hypothetical protein
MACRAAVATRDRKEAVVMFDWLWKLFSEDWLDKLFRAPSWRRGGTR